MGMQFNPRQFYPEELRLLKTLKIQKEKQSGTKIKFHHYAVAGLIAAGCTYMTATIPDSLWTFLFGTIAVFAFGFIVFTPYELYKQQKKRKVLLQQLNTVIDKGTVSTCQIRTKRIAVAPEYDDEGDLYIIELNEKEVFYLWDTEYNLSKKFPCLEFEIYEDNFFKLLSRQIYPLSEKIQGIRIDKKEKRDFMRKYGAPGHLQTEEISFDELLSKFNNMALASTSHE